MLSALRWFAGVVGAAALIGSTVALTAPASLYAVDRGGQPITCGTGLGPAYEAADREDAVNQRLHASRGGLFQPSSYSDDCAALISARRAVGIPAAVLGAVVVVAAMAFSVRRSSYVLVPDDVLVGPDPDAAPDPGSEATPDPEPVAVRDVVEDAVGAINRLATPRTSLREV